MAKTIAKPIQLTLTMAKTTKIQWTDSAINPVMGCIGCELWPTITQLVTLICEFLEMLNAREFVEDRLRNLLPSDVYHQRKELTQEFAKHSSFSPKEIEAAIVGRFKCYAGILHLLRGRDDTNPGKITSPGYAEKFERPKLFPGRMASAAAWKDLRGEYRPNEAWLNGLPRLIFVSDMGDALSPDVPFEYLENEIIQTVVSEKGRRHIWLWLTKQPSHMARFSDWLVEHGIAWPDNLVAMTSVTSATKIGRITQLGRVRAKYRALSVEPLWTPVTLPLAGISWVIVGGESGSGAQPFHLDWARDIIRQCRTAGVAPFVKQLGAVPFDGGRQLHLRDSHGGDWNEWPQDLRVREFPTWK